MKLTKLQLGGLFSVLPLLFLVGLRLLFSGSSPSDRLALYQPPVKTHKLEQKARTELNREEMNTQKELYEKESIRTQEEIAMSWGEIIEKGKKKDSLKSTDDSLGLSSQEAPQRKPLQKSEKPYKKPSQKPSPVSGESQEQKVAQSPQVASQGPALQKELESSSLLAKDRYSFIVKPKPEEASPSESPAFKERKSSSQEFYQASTHGAHSIQEGEVVRLVLEEALFYKEVKLPQGSLLQGVSSYYGGRLRITIRTVKTPEGLRNINLAVHDGKDFQEGISYQLNEKMSQLKDNLIDQGVSRIPVVGGIAHTVGKATASSQALGPKFRLEPGLRVYIKVE